MSGAKRSYANAIKPTWDRVDIVACSCPEKSYLHVHCPCEECNGRATSRKVELEHWRRSQLCCPVHKGKRLNQDLSKQSKIKFFLRNPLTSPSDKHL